MSCASFIGFFDDLDVLHWHAMLLYGLKNSSMWDRLKGLLIVYKWTLVLSGLLEYLCDSMHVGDGGKPSSVCCLFWGLMFFKRAMQPVLQDCHEQLIDVMWKQTLACSLPGLSYPLSWRLVKWWHFFYSLGTISVSSTLLKSSLIFFRVVSPPAFISLIVIWSSRGALLLFNCLMAHSASLSRIGSTSSALALILRVLCCLISSLIIVLHGSLYSMFSLVVLSLSAMLLLFFSSSLVFDFSLSFLLLWSFPAVSNAHSWMAYVVFPAISSTSPSLPNTSKRFCSFSWNSSFYSIRAS